MKRCIKCKIEKDLIEFHKNHKAKDKLHSYCKICNSNAAKLITSKNKDRINAKRRLKRANDPIYRDKIYKMKKEAYWKHRAEHFLMQAKQSSKRRNLECSITIEDIIIPEKCPILNVLLDRGRYSPSIDRIDNSKGYIKGNIWIISKAANRIKNDGTIKELLIFCNNLPKFIKEYDIV